MQVKRSIFLVILGIVFLVAVGCGNSSQVEEKASVANVAINDEIKFPEGSPDVTGKVKEIIGNEVTVDKMQMPQGQGMKKGEEKQEAQGNTNKSTETIKVPRITTTEETETFIIPVGTPIVVRQRGSAEVTRVELTELKKDQILNVWKNDDTVDFVQVMSSGGMRSSTGGGGGQRPQGAGGGMGGRPQ